MATTDQTDAAAIAEIIDDIFHAFETRDWHHLERHLAEQVEIDHTSLSGGAARYLDKADALKVWRCALHPQKQSFHMLSRLHIAVEPNRASARFNCHASNVLVAELGGGMWEVWGTHTLSFHYDPSGWKATRFHFDAFRTNGDDRVYRHTRND